MTNPERKTLEDVIAESTPAERAKIMIVMDTLCGSLDEPSYKSDLHQLAEDLIQEHGFNEETFLQYAS